MWSSADDHIIRVAADLDAPANTTIHKHRASNGL